MSDFITDHKEQLIHFAMILITLLSVAYQWLWILYPLVFLYLVSIGIQIFTSINFITNSEKIVQVYKDEIKKQFDSDEMMDHATVVDKVKAYNLQLVLSLQLPFVACVFYLGGIVLGISMVVYYIMRLVVSAQVVDVINQGA